MADNDRGPGALADFFRNIQGSYVDQTEALARGLGQVITFEHVPTGTRVTFKAFLKNFQDQYSSRWNAHSGYGRMDDVMQFESTKRTMTLGFDVVAGDLTEAKQNLSRISTLAQMLYPTFEGDSGPQTIKAAPLLKVKFMNWAQDSENGMGLVCACQGFAYQPTLEPGVFTAREKNGKNKNVLYPKVCTITTNLTIIHQHKLGWKFSEIKLQKGSLNYHSPQAPNFPYGQLIAGSPTPTLIAENNKPNPSLDQKDKNKITGENE
tara:strand:+ start:503 stop:1294 length:792 start_codon:yes stop_codon:yes gene_type:complete